MFELADREHLRLVSRRCAADQPEPLDERQGDGVIDGIHGECLVGTEHSEALPCMDPIVGPVLHADGGCTTPRMHLGLGPVDCVVVDHVCIGDGACGHVGHHWMACFE